MNLRPLLFLPPLALGVGGFIWLTSPDEVEVTPPAETATVVRVMTLTPSMAVPTASGYGRVTAEDRWQAISQVEGRVEYVAPGLEIGTVIAEGTEIIRVDPRDYEIALARAEASRGSAQAALDELKATEENTLSTIRLETRIQEVRKAELDRQQALLGRGSAAQASVDTVIRDLLAQEKMVLSLENSLRLLPSQRASLRSTIETRNVEIEEAGRVVASSVTKEQFVRVGDTLAEIESTAASEVTAEFHAVHFWHHPV